MRQLGIIAFLLIIVAFGTYYLVVERVNLDLYEAPTPFQFPQPKLPNPLPSIPPGPAFHSEFSEGPAPALSARPVTSRGAYGAQGLGQSRVTPMPVTAPTALTVTPMPAPTFESVTPPAMMHTPPPILAPEIKSPLNPEPTPSERARPEGFTPKPEAENASPSPSPKAPSDDESASPSPSPQSRSDRSAW
jgi:hypothetical protein